MAMAAKTWHGEWWKLGGGGAVWESISYDPELNLIYFGVGNGTEWNQGYRSAGQGDNLFLSSIAAQRRYRRLCLALPGNARRGVALRCRSAAGAC